MSQNQSLAASTTTLDPDKNHAEAKIAWEELLKTFKKERFTKSFSKLGTDYDHPAPKLFGKSLIEITTPNLGLPVKDISNEDKAITKDDEVRGRTFPDDFHSENDGKRAFSDIREE